jgi:lipoyl-dependent peroxiredoxin
LFRTRFENEKGTNPEELIAAAYAECFSMTLAFVLQGASYSASEIEVEAAVTIEPEGQGFRISRSALTVQAQVPNLDEATFARMVGDAEKGCPVSRVLNAPITVDAKNPGPIRPNRNARFNPLRSRTYMQPETGD